MRQKTHRRLMVSKLILRRIGVHLRKSNTEPIIRVYTEAKSQEIADNLADKIIEEIHNALNA